MYYMPSTGQVLKDHSAIRAAMPPNIMLPPVLQEPDLDFIGVHELRVDDCPADPATVFTPAAPVLRSGVWCQPWAARAATADEIGVAQAALIATVTQCVVDRLNAFAATRNYGDAQTSPIVAACSYAASEHPRYGPEGRYCMAMREQTWDILYQIQADVLAGDRPMPTGFAEIEPELPALVWPE
jgi:hypothetical protein